MSDEEWKDIPEFEGKYQISNLGRVKSLSRLHRTSKFDSSKGYYSKERILKPSMDDVGYLQVRILGKNGYKTKRVHLLVASAFLDNPYNLPVINHKDGNKQNNKVGNLEWCTHQYNVLHAYHNGLNSYRKRHLYKKRCEDAIKYINTYCPMLPSETKPIWNKILNILEDKNE